VVGRVDRADERAVTPGHQVVDEPLAPHDPDLLDRFGFAPVARGVVAHDHLAPGPLDLFHQVVSDALVNGSGAAARAHAVFPAEVVSSGNENGAARDVRQIFETRRGQFTAPRRTVWAGCADCDGAPTSRLPSRAFVPVPVARPRPGADPRS